MTDRSARPRRLQSLRDQDDRPDSEVTYSQQASASRMQQTNEWHPPFLSTLEDTGLTKLNIADLVLKVLYYGGDMTGRGIADTVKLPFSGVLDGVVEFLKREKYLEVRGGTGGFGEASLRYTISSMGAEKAREAMERSQYAGAAPVPIASYIESLHAQNVTKPTIRQRELRSVMENLVISDDMLNRFGPAVNSGRSIFLYGPPGNGKTIMSERVGRMVLGADMWIPYCIDVDGQIIQIYDSLNHELSDNLPEIKHPTGLVQDPRWVSIKRPMVMVGGELTLAGLDLVYDEINKFYESPFQVKANGGMFLIDDFGRQQVRPVDLLNRWIVPLEKGVDFLTLNNGRKIEIPFYVMIIFSTNLDPKDLVDEAFLRRIRHKIEVGNPTLDQFREIFQMVSKAKGVPYDENGLKYLLKRWYIDMDRDLRMVHPRDILTQLIDIASYLDVPATMSDYDLLDGAAASYFVEL